MKAIELTAAKLDAFRATTIAGLNRSAAKC